MLDPSDLHPARVVDELITTASAALPELGLNLDGAAGSAAVIAELAGVGDYSCAAS